MKISRILSRGRLLSVFSLVLLFSSAAFPQYLAQLNHPDANFFSDKSVGASSVTAAGTIGESDSGIPDSGEKPERVRVSIAGLERAAFDLLNQKRMEFGLDPVIWNDDVARIARMHSANMAQNNYFSHQGLDGQMVDSRADAAGLKGWKRIGENIAYNRGYDDPVGSAVSSWMNSATHRHNLLNDKWKESGIGIAVAPDGKSYYLTQVFIVRK